MSKKKQEFYAALAKCNVDLVSARLALSRALRVAPTADESETAARLLLEASTLARNVCDEVQAIQGWRK